MPGLEAVKACTVVYDVQDVQRLAERFAAGPNAQEPVLALTPNAGHAAAKDGYEVLPSAEYFGDRQQLDIVDRLTAIRAKADAELSKLPPPERELLRSQFDRMIFSLLRIEGTLRNFETCTVYVDGAWRTFDVQGDAVLALQRELATRRYAGQGREGLRIHPAPLPGLYGVLIGLVARAVRFMSRRGRIVSGAMKDVAGVVDAIAQRNGRVIVMAGAEGTWRDYASLAKQLWRIFQPNAPIVLRVPCDFDQSMCDAHVRVADATQEPLMKFAAQYADHIFRQSVVGFNGARRQLDRLFKIVEPTAYLASEISQETDLLTAECAGLHAVPRIVLGRNAQGPTTDPKAFDVKRLYLRTRYPGGLVDVAVFWSDFGAAAGRQYLDDGIPVGRITQAQKQPAPGGADIQNAAGRKKRRILVADTYGAWWTRHWWALQTSDEFIAGLRLLADAVRDFDDVELVVRAKEKVECSVATLTEMFAGCPNMTVEGLKVPFAQSMAQSDLVVSFFSTTIQEALSARRPVLLFGGTRRHYYMPPRFTPPTKDNRAAVYGHDGSVDLTAFLASVLDAHAGRPLEDGEQSGFAEDPRAPSAFDFGAALAAGEMPRLYMPETGHGE